METTNTGLVCANCRVLVVADGERWVHPRPWREKFSDVVCESPEPGRTPKPREARYGRGDPARADKFSHHGAIPTAMAAGDAVALATNGAHKVSRVTGHFDGVSWGYLATNGDFGLGTAVMTTQAIGAKPGVHAELRAIWRGMRRVLPHHPVLLVTNNTRAVTLIEAWRDGRRPMPAGYDIRVRPSGRKATLVELAELMHEHASRVQAMWVQAGSGMAISEGADALARLAQAWASKRLTTQEVTADAQRVARRSLM